MRVTEPIRLEHKGLIPEIEKLRQSADSIGDLPIEALLPLIDDNRAFLHHHLLPHAAAEENVLYPAVANVMGSKESTRTMVRDHQAIKELTERLDVLRDNWNDNQVREVLYGLYALISVHFAKEEEIYLTLLDEGLSDDEASHLLHELEHAGHH